MRKLVSVLASLLLIAGFVIAQQPTNPTPTTAQPNAEQKARLKELASTWERKVKEADAARDKYLLELMSALAELGLKPSETAITWNDKGEPVFTRVEPPKTQAQSATPKPEVKP